MLNARVSETNEARMAPEVPSFSVAHLREKYGAGDTLNAEQHAEQLADHIRAIDEELDALGQERRRIAEECIQACEAMSVSREKYSSVADNTYRDPKPGVGGF